MIDSFSTPLYRGAASDQRHCRRNCRRKAAASGADARCKRARNDAPIEHNKCSREDIHAHIADDRARDRIDRRAWRPGARAGEGGGIWHTETEPQTIKAFNDIARRFEAKNPGVKIAAEGLAWTVWKAKSWPRSPLERRRNVLGPFRRQRASQHAGTPDLPGFPLSSRLERLHLLSAEGEYLNQRPQRAVGSCPVWYPYPPLPSRAAHNVETHPDGPDAAGAGPAAGPREPRRPGPADRQQHVTATRWTYSQMPAGPSRPNHAGTVSGGKLTRWCTRGSQPLPRRRKTAGRL